MSFNFWPVASASVGPPGPPGPPGSGTVTSVALTAPPEFTVGGSPVTAAGTLALTKADENANKVWAGPASGADAAPAFRRLVSADMPPLTGTGTVTSVDLTAPTEFTVTGNPVTTNGTLAIAANTQIANKVMAGPTTGVPAVPHYRSLVTADLPAGVGTVTAVTGTAPLTSTGGATPAIGCPNVVGDSGAGGTAGLVPAPAAGDTAAGKFLKADGTYQVPPNSGGTVTAVTGTAPLTSTGGATPAIGCPNVVGDSGAGGTAGLVPAPAAGDTAAGKFLKADGTYQVPPGTSSGALVLLEQHTASNSATLNFTTCISSLYDEYEIHFIGIIPTSGPANFSMRMSSDGGATYYSGSDYHWGLMYSGIGDVPTQSSGTSTAQMRLTGSTSNPGTYASNGRLRLYNPLGTVLLKFIEGSIQSVVGATGVYQWHSASVCIVSASTPMDAFQFLFEGAPGPTIASGIIRVYGIAK